MCLLLTRPALAQTSPGESTPTQAHFDRGLLWKIGTGSPGPSYVFGTIHSADPRVVRLPPAVQAAFDESEHFCLELVLDARASSVLAQRMVLAQDQSLREVLGGPLFDAAVPVMAGRGVPEPALLRLKPWAVVMLLSGPRHKTGQVLDLSLYERARQQGKSICGLETVEEQVAVFDTAPVAEQVILLRDSVTRYAEQSALLPRLIERYLARDLAGLVSLSQESGPTDAAVKRVVDGFMQRLLAQRNPRLVERMDAVIRSGGAFIAVGALHLPGEQGVLRLLRQGGYTLEAIY